MRPPTLGTSSGAGAAVDGHDRANHPSRPRRWAEPLNGCAVVEGAVESLVQRIQAPRPSGEVLAEKR
jgi:hypothetical protein